MRRVHWGAVARSALAGALSGGVCAAVEVYADARWPDSPVTYWLVLGLATGVAAALEIAFIYWDTLRSVHELARVAGLELFGPERRASDEALIDALARAALELPNPVDVGAGINPHREARKWQLLLASLAYKAKIGVTNFLVKLLLRRLLGRAALRSWLPFVAVPVTALWNGVVSWLILREARIRALGPSAIEELSRLLFADADAVSAEGRLAALRAVASAIVRTQDLHPNLLRLLEVTRRHVGDTGAAELDDVGLFLAQVARLSEAERTLALRVLAVALAVDGRLTSRERALWLEARSAAGRPPALTELERLRVDFVRGNGAAAGVLMAL